MVFESLAISARVTKQIVTIFSKTCDNALYCRADVTVNLLRLCVEEQVNCVFDDI